MKDIRRFIVLTFAVSLLCWLPLMLMSTGRIPALPAVGLLKLLGALSPAVAGLVLTGRAAGSSGVRKLLGNSFTAWRSPGWIIVAVGGLMLLSLTARTLFGLFEHNLPRSTIVTGPATFLGFTAVVFFFGGGLDEEIGWRGFLTRRLLARTTPIRCILITGSVWILWHLPLFWIAGTNQAMLGIAEFILPVAALNIVVTWIYWRTESVLLCALLHTFGNVWHEVFPVIPTEAAPNPLGFHIYTALIMAIALLILILDVRLYGKRYILTREG